MAKRRKPKAATWIKVEGQWVKVKVTYCKAKPWTRGIGPRGGWEPHAGCDMAERHHIHVTKVNGKLLKEAI